MASFEIYGPKSDGTMRPEHIVLVREAFSVWGFLLPLPYCLWQRNWRFAGLLVLIGGVIGLLPEAGIPVNEMSAIGFELLTGLYVGCAAADIRSAALARKGYQMLDIAIARDENAAFLRFLDQHLQPSPAVHSPSASDASAQFRSFGTSDVLGLFPESQR